MQQSNPGCSRFIPVLDDSGCGGDGGNAGGDGSGDNYAVGRDGGDGGSDDRLVR